MGELLLGIVLVLAVIAAAGVFAVGLLLRSVRRKVRVTRHDAVGAPVTWLAMPGPAASLHRRLRRAVQALRASVPEPTRRQRRRGELHQLQHLALELEQHASVVAHDLLVVGRLRGPYRDRSLVALRSQVEEIERLCARVAFATSSTSLAPAPADPTVLRRLGEELDALEAAHAELALIERQAGLHRPAPTAAPLPPPGRALPR